MEKKASSREYYLGLDIGTDSVGYAAVDPSYELLKFHGEPVWGATTFDSAALAEERRMHRTERRRLDRRQQRVQLLSEIFAQDICAIDPDFFVRRKESALFASDTQHGVQIFNGGISDSEYHKRYPTIHHLIFDLMKTDEPRDIRLVYLACAWLIANRGHFLLDAAAEQVMEFDIPYQAFAAYFLLDLECDLPWSQETAPALIQNIMQAEVGVTRKKAMFTERVYGGKKPSNRSDAGFPFRRDCIIALLSGGKAALKDLFDNDAYAELPSVSLGMDEEGFARILSELGEDGALLRVMRNLYDCALLNVTLHGYKSISESKIAVYDQHAADLKWLKRFIKKYKPASYHDVFRAAAKENYTAYSYNLKSCSEPQKVEKRAGKAEFSEYLLKVVKNISVEEAGRAGYDDMIARLERNAFLPKQKDTDNRVIPQQLYRIELVEILRRAGSYLPMLHKADETGLTNAEKIISIFDFRVPYYVGPMNSLSSHAWLSRKPGRIYPWNLETQVDLDESERRFICRMTNTCTYLPGEGVLPYNSFLYSRFMVLNELNNLKVNQRSIPVALKQELYTNLFLNSRKKVTRKTVEAYLRSRGYLHPNDELSGIDAVCNAGLRPYHSFMRMLDGGILTEAQAEDIILHAAYSEEPNRMARWLRAEYPELPEADLRYILHLNLKGFGRLSRRFLTEICGSPVDGSSGAMSIIDALWNTNENLMQLLSERYTFRDQIEAYTQEYYADPGHRKSLSERLSDMYISNAVKRPIIRALDVVSDVVKAMGGAPQKIFVEMARGGAPDQKGKRTVTRKQQLLALYKCVHTEDALRLMRELEGMGETADNRLQSDRLFLYYLQLGRCMYTGEAIDLSQLATKIYDIDHIYPQSKVQDDSVLNNKVLVLSTANGAKGDRYPVDEGVRAQMADFWALLRRNGLITDEKYQRLTRAVGFTEEELHRFIQRQLVETRQSTKAVAQLLKERYPKTEIVYVKAGMVSEFRQEYKMLKSRAINDLHHAKDAYLNVVVGNVYHEKFTKRWFDTSQRYNISVKKVFSEEQRPYGVLVWRGAADLARVRTVMGKNAVRLTRYAFCRKGGLFDQNPLKAGPDLIPRKKDLPTEKYGGYRKPTASFFLLADCSFPKKRELMILPIALMAQNASELDADAAAAQARKAAEEITGKELLSVRFPLGLRPLKVNTVFSFDGLLMTLGGKSGGGRQLLVSPMTPLILSKDEEAYIKALESFQAKRQRNSGIGLDPAFSVISEAGNLALYDRLTEKLNSAPFRKLPGNQYQTLKNGRDAFIQLPVDVQALTLLNIVMLFSSTSGGCDLRAIGGSKNAGVKVISSTLSNWKKNYADVRILDLSASGLFGSRSGNLLELL